MAKWKSPIFSDIRNKLGNNVVFSMWKGRPYMRRYVQPANPQSDAQQRRRNWLQTCVASWHNLIAVKSDVPTIWDAVALSDGISGFNKFIKEALKSSIEAPSNWSTGSNETVTYTVGFPVQYAEIWAVGPTPGSSEKLADPVDLEEGTDKTKDLSISGPGDYLLYICDNRAEHPDDDASNIYARQVCMLSDPGTGTAPTECLVHVT